MGKKFNQFLRNAAKLGIYVGDINQATTAFQGGGFPDPPAPPAPTPVAPPKRIRKPTQENATLAQAGAGVGKARRTRRKQRSDMLRIARRVGRGGGSGTGTGLNTNYV